MNLKSGIHRAFLRTSVLISLPNGTQKSEAWMCPFGGSQPPRDGQNLRDTPHLEGHADLVSRLITPTVAYKPCNYPDYPRYPLLTYLLSPHGPPSNVRTSQTGSLHLSRILRGTQTVL